MTGEGRIGRDLEGSGPGRLNLGLKFRHSPGGD